MKICVFTRVLIVTRIGRPVLSAASQVIRKICYGTLNWAPPESVLKSRFCVI